MQNSSRAPDAQVDAHIGRVIRIRRRLLGLSQNQLAQACGVRFQQVQKYESGANRIAASRLWRISHALGIPLAAFFDGLPDPATVRAPDGGPLP